jgi:hypothetical protein
MSVVTLAPDAAMAMGLAATAMPFARTTEDEAERWLRVLRLHGEAGVVLQALGVSEGPLRPPASGEADAQRALDEERNVVAQVSAEAVALAERRGADAVATTDLLRAVMYIYGETFDRALRAHGTDRDEVEERLGERQPPSSPLEEPRR